MHFQSLSSYKKFQSSVQTKSRFILDDESNYFLKAIEDTCEKRIKTILTSEYLWRAQLGCDYRPLDQEGTIVDELPTPFEPKRMKPLNDRASEGRANPKGIPYLYVATDKETAMSEVRPSLEAILSIGRFKPTKELNIIDFSIPSQGPRKISFKEPNNLSPNDIEKTVWNDINNAFSIPISNSDLDSNYIPTQIIAELIKSLGYDGITYKSSLGKGHNITLFDLESASISECDIYKVSAVKFDFIEESNQYIDPERQRRTNETTKAWD